MHYVDLGESFLTHIYLQNLASIQPRTSPVKFADCHDCSDVVGEASAYLFELDNFAGLKKLKHTLQDLSVALPKRLGILFRFDET